MIEDEKSQPQVILYCSIAQSVRSMTAVLRYVWIYYHLLLFPKLICSHNAILKYMKDYNEIIRTCRLAIDFLIGRTNWIKIWISMWMAVVKHLLNIFKNKFVLIPENGFPPTICNHNFYIMRVHLLSADMTRKEIVLGEIVVWPLHSKCFIYSGWCK